MSASAVSVEQDSPRILIVEDDRVVALDLKGTLAELGYAVAGTATRGEDAIDQVQRLQPDLILMDIRLSGKIDGIQAAHVIRTMADVPIIYLTAHSDRDTLLRATSTIASGYLIKPYKATELRCAIEVALHKHQFDLRMRTNELWLSTTLQSLDDAVIATDTAGRVRLMNRTAERMTGWPRGDAEGRPLEDVLTLTDPSGNVTKHLDGPEVALRSREGVRTAVEVKASPIEDALGRRFGMVIICRDASEHERQLKQIRELNAQLEGHVDTSTADLDAFSYSVAHDLRTPLRGIDSFSALLLEQYRHRLDETGIGYIHRVRRSVARMAALIDDLLALARVGHEDMLIETIDLTALATRLLETLKATHASHRIEGKIAPDMIAQGDPRLMRIALGNLLDNACKFTGRSSDARVEVGVVEDARVPTYFVRDNGAGFDPAHSNKLFGAFQRLHGEDEFPGTGIGLAIVQRVIARHRGRIWAESRLGSGSTFYFTLSP